MGKSIVIDVKQETEGEEDIPTTEEGLYEFFQKHDPQKPKDIGVKFPKSPHRYPRSSVKEFKEFSHLDNY